MIDYLVGTVKDVQKKAATVLVNGIGFSVRIPQLGSVQKDKEIELYIYMHWNQEKGPSLFGFHEKLERDVFLLIIDCPKIGPGIAVNILSQLKASQFLEIITTQSEKSLSAINGIGAKKAEQIIMHVKGKVAKLIADGNFDASDDQSFTQWQNVSDVLTSLNYTKPEITQALKHLSDKHVGQELVLDQMIRLSLSYLSQNKL